MVTSRATRGILLNLGVTLLLCCVFSVPGYSRELRVALTDFSGENLDPIHGGIGSLPFHLPMYDFLVHISRDLELVPGLAASWRHDAEYKVFTFRLREDVRFHDDTVLSATHVKDHFQRLEGGTGNFSGRLLSLIEDIVVEDQHTVSFLLREPAPDFIFYLSPLDTTIGAIARRSEDEQGNYSLIGTGPWRLQRAEPGRRYRFERQPHPFRGEDAGYSTLHLVFVPEESTRIAMLRRGELDVIEVGADGATQLRKRGKKILRAEHSTIAFLSFIGIWEPQALSLSRPTQIQNTTVRRALALAIDRANILEHLLGGYGDIATGFLVFPGDAGYESLLSEVGHTEFDPDKARQLLRDAGYPTGFELTVYSVPLANAPWFPRIMQVIASNWRDIGIDVTMQTVEWGAVAPIIYSRPEQALGAVFNLRTSRTLFPETKLETYISAAGRSAIAAVDWHDIATDMLGTADPAVRRTRFLKAVIALLESYAVLPLFYVDAIYAADGAVGGCGPIDGWPSLALSFDCMAPSDR